MTDNTLVCYFLFQKSPLIFNFKLPKQKWRYCLKPEIIVALGFAGENLANKAVAERAKRMAHFYEISVFTEESIYALLENLPTGVLFARAGDRPLSTLRVIKELKGSEYVRKNTLTRVLLIAPPCRERRCARDLRRMGFRVRTDVYFRRHGLRLGWWADKYPTSRARWWMREIFLRALPWSVYSQITG